MASSMMGMTMIVGIVTEVAIFYVAEYADLSGERDVTVARADPRPATTTCDRSP